MRARLRRLALLALALTACEPGGGESIFDIDAEGFIAGLVFRDENASGTPDASDTPAFNVPVALVVAGTNDTIARAHTAIDGTFSFTVPIGRYELTIPASALGDTLRLVFRDPPGTPVGENAEPVPITLGVDDSVVVGLGIAYPTLTVEEARALPTGRSVFVRAIALAPTGAAGDSSLYVQGATRAIRATRVVTGAVATGDSVVVFGVTATRDGQPVLANGRPIVLGSESAIDTAFVDAEDARTAAGGFLDAQLAHVDALAITDTTTTGTRFVITAEDPSGLLEIVIPVTARDTLQHAPGAVLDATGILVPKPGVQATWQLRPRSVVDDIIIRDD